jgi:hypothetical protein
VLDALAILAQEIKARGVVRRNLQIIERVSALGELLIDSRTRATKIDFVGVEECRVSAFRAEVHSVSV